MSSRMSPVYYLYTLGSLGARFFDPAKHRNLTSFNNGKNDIRSHASRVFRIALPEQSHVDFTFIGCGPCRRRSFTSLFSTCLGRPSLPRGRSSFPRVDLSQSACHAVRYVSISHASTIINPERCAALKDPKNGNFDLPTWRGSTCDVDAWCVVRIFASYD